MKKRGQITLFILIGMIIFIFLVFIIFLRQRVVEKTSEFELKKSVQRGLDRNSIIHFVEDCLRQVSEKAVFTRIGPQGGYIDPSGDSVNMYGDEGVPQGSSYIVSGKKKIANYVIIEFENCADFSEYEKNGYNITKPEINYVENNFDFKTMPVDVN